MTRFWLDCESGLEGAGGRDWLGLFGLLVFFLSGCLMFLREPGLLETHDYGV